LLLELARELDEVEAGDNGFLRTRPADGAEEEEEEEDTDAEEEEEDMEEEEDDEDDDEEEAIGLEDVRSWEEGEVRFLLGE